MTAIRGLSLSNVVATRYRMPLKRAYGTARGVTTAGDNFLIQLTAVCGNNLIEGLGECQPRHALTGDGGKDRAGAWSFAGAATRHLRGRILRFSSSEEAVVAVRNTMAELESLAGDHADDSNRDRPFRGTLLGFEVALLDVTSRALGLQISELLGKKRDTIGISISTISSATSIDELAAKVVMQERFPITRVKGVGDVAHDLKLLEMVAQANRSVGREKPSWIDINEAMDFEEASGLVRGIAERMGASVLPSSLVVEGMLPKAQVTRLPELQRLADDECRRTTKDHDIDLRIMPDEGLWDKEDLERLNALGGCRAINIKAPKAGGLLASLDLAEAAVAANPEVHISIGGMVGTSDITAWALHNLARALPRVDYLTAVPPGNVEVRISTPLAKYAGRDSNIIARQKTPGLGTRVLAHKVAPYIEATHDTAAVADTARKTAGVTMAAHVNPPSTLAPSPARTLVFAGDTSLGDLYVHRRGGKLQDRLEQEPMSFFQGLQTVVADHDALILNLETVLADSPSSPFEGRKPYLGWDSPSRTIGCLRDLGVDAVSLANNHTVDFGDSHMLDTKISLERAGIATFGAGATRAEAAAPLVLALNFNGTERRVYVIGAMQIQSQLRDEFNFYAGASRPGVNGMSRSRIASTIKTLRAKDPGSLIVAFPHWGRNYRWVSESQQLAANAFCDAGANLIIGHGAHTLQQCSFAERQAVVYSLGNFMFNWGGRFDEFSAPPFGLVARVDIAPEGEGWQIGLRLYPIMVDNHTNDHQPAVVDEEQFRSAWAALSNMDVDGSFLRRARAAEDALGRHISFSYATDSRSFSVHQTLSATRGEAADLDSPNVYSDSGTTRLLGMLNRRLLGSLLIAREAEESRATVEWLSSDSFIASLPDTQILFLGNRCTESVPASRLVKDKALLKDILIANSVVVPAGGAASTRDEAMRIFNRLPRPVVVKPQRGDRGKGVTVDVSSPTELELAYDRAYSEGGVLVEEMVKGREFRCLITPDDCLAVYAKDAPHVRGDAHHSIRELIDQRNHLRQANPALLKKLIVVDEQMTSYLGRSGLTLQSVPDRGEKIWLNNIANSHLGGDTIECTETAPSIVKETAMAAVRAVPGLSWAGVDIVLEDESPDIDSSRRATVLEVNVNAGIANFHYPLFGKPKGVARRLWQVRLDAATRDTLNDVEVRDNRVTRVRLTNNVIYDGDGGSSKRIDLSAKFAQYLSSRGLSVTDLGQGLALASRGAEARLIYGCTGIEDLSIVSGVTNRHTIVRKLLRRSKVPVPVGLVVSGVEDMAGFLAKRNFPALVLPIRGEADRAGRPVVDSRWDRMDLLKVLEKVKRGRSVILQELRPGVRLKVFATRNGAKAVIGPGDLGPEHESGVSYAEKLAVEAVRAVPGLRWAAVNVMVPYGTHAWAAGEGPVVESMTMRPEITGDDVLVAGRIEDFFDAILPLGLQPVHAETDG